ncbi:MAG: lytic transglycosylase domain-containing protein [Alphaproteobacteria bacterium]
MVCFAGPPALATQDVLRVAAVPPGSDEIGHEADLPRILIDSDIALYRDIFALQEAGDLRAAATLIKLIENPVLLGHVQAQKYLHPTAHRSSFDELKHWLEEYADLPQARRIYRLAMRRKPASARAPHKPIAPMQAVESNRPAVRTGYISPRKRSNANRRELINLLTHIRKHLRRGQLTKALEHLDGPKLNRLADDVERDIISAEVAFAFFIRGKDKTALALGSQSSKRSGDYVPLGYWTAGLAAYRLGDLETARLHFEGLAAVSRGPAPLIASGAFWAARLNLMTRRPERVSRHLAIAADNPRSFYGLLANRALGQEIEFAWEPPTLTKRDIKTVMRIPEVVRAIALAEAGQIAYAEKEIRRLRPEANPALGKAMLALATRIGLPATQLRVAQSLAKKDGRRHDGGLYPLPLWKPESGYLVDRALLFALMRQESAFNVRAKSKAGARGLMQLMPRTASFIARDNRIHRSRREFLFQPEFNIELGQKYVLHLLANPNIADNLMLTIAAYNGGPGNLRKWMRRTEFNDDPLLFKESLPARETRLFIGSVFTNLWIYRARLGQDAPSLDAIAGGQWPLYKPRDPSAIAHLVK